MSAHIVVATGLYPPDIGGPATYARMIEQGLPERDISLTVVPYGPSRKWPVLLRHAIYFFRLYKASRNCDGIYSLDPISVGVASSLVARLRKTPFLIRLGGDYAWEQGRQRFGVSDSLDVYTAKSKKHYSLFVRLLAHIQIRVVSSADLVIVPSEYLRSVVLCWPNVEETKVKVIYSALYPLAVTETKTSLREQLGYEGYVIVSASRLVPWKGFMSLLEAFLEVRRLHEDITLVIAGDGPDREAMEEYIEANDLAQYVRMVGALGKETLGVTIAGADLFVLNTGYEGLSHQLLEVMDLGVPILTTEVGGNPELIKHGQHGHLVEYNNIQALAEAIVHLKESPDLTARYVQNARLRSKDFHKDIVQDQLAHCINTLCQKT